MGMDGLGRDAIGVQLLHARGRRNLGAVEALLAEAKRRRCTLDGHVHLGLVSSHADALLDCCGTTAFIAMSASASAANCFCG